MWLRVVALLFSMLPGLALAQGAEPAVPRPVGPVAGALDPRRPAEPPPPDFTGRQYIDSGGCVFLRTDAGWRARLSREGAPICGWPPTFAARVTSPPPLPGAEPRAAQIERLLTETIITNLHEGELVAGDTPLAAPDAGSAAAAVAPGAAGADVDPLGIGQMIATAPELRRQLLGPGRAAHMCQLLGPGDPLGLCGPATNRMAAADPELTIVPALSPATSAVASTPQVARAAPPPPATGATAAPTVAAATPRQAPPPTARPPTATPPASSAASSPAIAVPAPRRTETRAEAPLLIPPGARYLEVGAFKEPLDAHRLAQKLVAMGLPVVRSKPGQTALSVVMVGPLEGREAMVRMADRLRQAGFTRLVAR